MVFWVFFFFYPQSDVNNANIQKFIHNILIEIHAECIKHLAEWGQIVSQGEAFVELRNRKNRFSS